MKARLIAQVECPACGSTMKRLPERGIVCPRLDETLARPPGQSCSIALSGVVFDDFVNLVPLETPAPTTAEIEHRTIGSEPED